MGDYLNQHSNGVWRARVRVPEALRKIVGKRELVKSLGTRDKREAEKRKHAVLASFFTMLDDARERLNPSPTSVKTESTPTKEKANSDDLAEKEVLKHLLRAIYFDEQSPTEPLEDDDIGWLALDYVQDYLEFDDRWRQSGRADEEWLHHWSELAQQMEAAGRRAYGLGQADQILDDEVDYLLRRHGYSASPQQKRVLATTLVKAWLPAIRVVLRRLDGEVIETSETIESITSKLGIQSLQQSPSFPEGGPKKGPPTRNRYQEVLENFHGLGEDASKPWSMFVGGFHEHNATSATRKKEYDAEFARLKRAIGDKVISEISRPDIVRYKDQLLQEAKPKAGRKTIASDTQSKAFSCIRSFFDYAFTKCLVVGNPSDVLVVTKEPKQVTEKLKKLPWSTDDLKKIFSAPLYMGCKSEHYVLESGSTKMNLDSRYWFGLIALMTGARKGELEQLLISDVEEGDDLTYLHIRIECDASEDDAEDVKKSLKTDNAKRIIPVHPELIRCGFFEFLAHRKASGDQGLFKKRGYGQFFNDRNRFFDKCGVKTPQKTFHSFRHVFRDMVRGIKSDETRDRLLGHAPATAGRAYGSPLVEEEAKTFIDVVSPPVDLRHLYVNDVD